MDSQSTETAIQVDRFAIGVIICVAAAYGFAWPDLSIASHHSRRAGCQRNAHWFQHGDDTLGIVASAPFIPWLARRFGALRLAILCALSTATMYALIGSFQNVWLWFPLRFLLGMSIDVLYVVSETWLLQLAGRQYRGRLIGLYATAMATGFSIGPFVLALVGSEGMLAFAIGITVMLFTAIGLLSLRGRIKPAPEQQPARVFQFVLLAPMMLLTISVIALFDQISLSLLPVYLLDHDRLIPEYSIELLH